MLSRATASCSTPAAACCLWAMGRDKHVCLMCCCGQVLHDASVRYGLSGLLLTVAALVLISQARLQVSTQPT